MVIVGPAERTLLPLAVRHDCLLISKNSNLGLFVHIITIIYNTIMQVKPEMGLEFATYTQAALNSHIN